MQLGRAWSSVSTLETWGCHTGVAPKSGLFITYNCLFLICNYQKISKHEHNISGCIWIFTFLNPLEHEFSISSRLWARACVQGSLEPLRVHDWTAGDVHNPCDDEEGYEAQHDEEAVPVPAMRGLYQLCIYTAYIFFHRTMTITSMSTMNIIGVSSGGNPKWWCHTSENPIAWTKPGACLSCFMKLPFVQGIRALHSSEIYLICIITVVKIHI